MQILDAVSCGNQYTDAATISEVYSSNGGYFVVSTNDTFAQLEYGGQGQTFWTREFHVPVGPGLLQPGTTGIRFRNYTAGQTAVVSAALSEEAEPSVALTSAGTVNVTGSTINFQHNGVKVAAEPTADFVDVGPNIWTVADDAANTRVTVALAGAVVLTGIVASSGTVFAGTGFTSVRNSAGNYTVTYNAQINPNALPFVFSETTNIIIHTTALSASAFTYACQDRAAGTAADADCHFIVVRLA